MQKFRKSKLFEEKYTYSFIVYGRFNSRAYIGSSMIVYVQSEVIKIILGIILAISSVKILFD